MRKIAFFDIDGTLTSEIDGSIQRSAVDAIRAARENGNLMFINSGRCLSIIEKRFRDIGWDGLVLGCGTHIICDGKDILYRTLPRTVIDEIADAARESRIDLHFEGRSCMCFTSPETLRNDWAKHYYEYLLKTYKMPESIYEPGFSADKFVIWLSEDSDLELFRKTSDKYFQYIDRDRDFKEFVPLGFSKATGLQAVLDYYGLPLEAAYAFGDSNNDLAMLTYVPNSIAMGNAQPASLFDKVSYRTGNASGNGIQDALAHFGFI